MHEDTHGWCGNESLLVVFFFLSFAWQYLCAVKLLPYYLLLYIERKGDSKNISDIEIHFAVPKRKLTLWSLSLDQQHQFCHFT